MKRTIFIARPRLDCSFKPGVVPAVVRQPLNPILERFGHFIDQLEAHHENRGDRVISDLRPLWQFGLEEMQACAANYDRVYFPHRLRQQFPIGDNAWFYKNAPLADFMTIDQNGWGASLSFLPLTFQVNSDADLRFAELVDRVGRNESIFSQPEQGPAPVATRYHLFLCQVPHDETIIYHSIVSVADALSAVLAWAQANEVVLVVKGHPANPRSMEPLKAMVARSNTGVWVDDISIHTCIANAEAVFLVNSGSGMEVLIHGKPLVRFGRAEYDQVVPKATLDSRSIEAALRHQSLLPDRAAFLDAYLSRCVRIDDPLSFAHVLDGRHR